MADYRIGLDLGQSRDFSALVVAERVQVFDKTAPDAYRDEGRMVYDEYHVRHVQRWQLGTPYNVVVEQVGELMQTPELRLGLLVLDRTGVGGAVADMFAEAFKGGLLGDVRPRALSLTAGFSGQGRGYGWSTAHKGDLIGRLLVLLERGRLKVPLGLPLADKLTAELRAFKLKQNVRTGHVSYEAERQADHDDLVIALALSLWYAKGADLPRHFGREGDLIERW